MVDKQKRMYNDIDFEEAGRLFIKSKTDYARRKSNSGKKRISPKYIDILVMV